MSFTNKNKSIMSRVYESLTRSARRKQDRLKTYSFDAYLEAFFELEGYKRGVYDTLQKLSVELTSSGKDADLGTYRMLTRPKRGPFVIS